MQLLLAQLQKVKELSDQIAQAKAAGLSELNLSIVSCRPRRKGTLYKNTATLLKPRFTIFISSPRR
jgi:hypothetical protein